MTPATMRAWEVTGPHHPGLLRGVERPVPDPGRGELLLKVRACGVCRTDLHLAEGDLPARAPARVPGHEVVGEVVGHGPGLSSPPLGARVGVAWLRGTCGRCRWCRGGEENLCHEATFTGWDADGGFAEYVVAPAAYAYDLPPVFDDIQAAPLLCAGIIGYRALKRARLPDGGRLGLYGFGASAHLTAQIAMAQGAEVHVLTRGSGAQELARRLGAASVGGPYDRPPVRMDSAIVFAPAGELVPMALESLEQGGTVAVAGIHLTDIPALDYGMHLFRERNLTSVTANTRADGMALLRLAATLGISASVSPYPFDEADRALGDLADGRVTGVAVLVL